MKIKIRKDALEAYLRRVPYTYPKGTYAELLEKVAGKEYEVETEYLFQDQYNIGKVEGSENGLRIMEYLVEEVIDDIRIFMQRCNWCGRSSRISDTCPTCRKGNHLERFNKFKDSSSALRFIAEADYDKEKK